ncbi:MAG TPA: hypothetical protein VJU78_21215 [Chitinophagaceae bacterium]|nr:hypothetical protein [Chitinophagaceae bacterium]
MLTEEILASYSMDELIQLLRVKLAAFEQLESGSLKEREIARIELDLIEFVIDERKKLPQQLNLIPRPT